MAPEVTKSDEEWRAQLSPEQYEVLRRAATERPWSGKYVHNHDDGTYRCAGCGAVLFDSATKFESGSGWPSFYEPAVAEAVETDRGSEPGHGPHRGAVPALRRPPRSRLRRWAAADRAALLHELAGPGVRAGRLKPELATSGPAPHPRRSGRLLEASARPRSAGPEDRRRFQKGVFQTLKPCRRPGFGAFLGAAMSCARHRGVPAGTSRRPPAPRRRPPPCAAGSWRCAAPDVRFVPVVGCASTAGRPLAWWSVRSPADRSRDLPAGAPALPRAGIRSIHGATAGLGTQGRSEYFQTLQATFRTGSTGPEHGLAVVAQLADALEDVVEGPVGARPSSVRWRRPRDTSAGPAP